MIYAVVKKINLYSDRPYKFGFGKNAKIGTAIGAVAGGLGGALYDSKREKKEGENWFQRNKGAVLGAVGGAGAGYLGGNYFDNKALNKVVKTDTPAKQNNAHPTKEAPTVSAEDRKRKFDNAANQANRETFQKEQAIKEAKEAPKKAKEAAERAKAEAEIAAAKAAQQAKGQPIIDETVKKIEKLKAQRMSEEMSGITVDSKWYDSQLEKLNKDLAGYKRKYKMDSLFLPGVRSRFFSRNGFSYRTIPGYVLR